MPPGHAKFVAQESQGDWEKAKKLFLKVGKDKDFESKVKGKRPIQEFLEIYAIDAKRISKYYEEAR